MCPLVTSHLSLCCSCVFVDILVALKDVIKLLQPIFLRSLPSLQVVFDGGVRWLFCIQWLQILRLGLLGKFMRLLGVFCIIVDAVYCMSFMFLESVHYTGKLLNFMCSTTDSGGVTVDPHRLQVELIQS
ncbi:uncharacterized protein BJ171DRAFT_511506 [Polychytrium aggregatum]|uniref:uncharacterized protein n=1 Tax=Polychytrium aggregatum TaxID=110093 RepID=UPI0022FE0706|nr:uncharacterized protein BJ171DRAFT_511506 [Polychytrium aggregatum]KAI9203006.1 hypothetical protein BJ171DRAFT_511506 [Polychytrium aggregatum]